jgi:hypothetical protein
MTEIATTTLADLADLSDLQQLPAEDTSFEDLTELGLRPCAMTCWLFSCIRTFIGEG